MPDRETILLVDDSLDDAALFVRGLKRKGVTNPVHTVSSGAEALEYLKSCDDGNLPKLVLLDGRMPGMDGFEVLRTIRANPAWGDLAVVMLTGSDSMPELDRAYQEGATSFIAKPTTSTDMDYVIGEFRKRWLR